jgi:hypothetical protein
LSTFAPGPERAFAVLTLVDRGFPERGIVYPTQGTEKIRRYYLYDLVFAGSGSAGAPGL